MVQIGDGAFYNCNSLLDIKVDSENTKYDSRNECSAIVETATNELKFGCKVTEIPGTVTAIGDGAFYGCTLLENIEIPKSVVSIGNYAFYGCSKMYNIKIGKSVEKIGKNVFGKCSSLETIDIPDSVTSISENAFQGSVVKKIKWNDSTYEDKSTYNTVRAFLYDFYKLYQDDNETDNSETSQS